MRDATNATIKADGAVQDLTKSEIKLREVQADPRFKALSKDEQDRITRIYETAAATERVTAAEDLKNKLLGKAVGLGKEYYDTLEIIENTERFILLKDIYYTAHPNVSSTNAGVQVVREVFKGYLPLKALETVYNGNDAPMTISDINVGGLYMVPRCAFSMFGNGGTCQTTLDGSFRLRYFDN